MRIALIICTCLYASTVVAENPWQDWGQGNRWKADKPSSQPQVETTYDQKGNTSTTIGDTTINSDGTTSQQTGNTRYKSDGTSSHRIGNFEYFDNGVVCHDIGSFRYCD